MNKALTETVKTPPSEKGLLARIRTASTALSRAERQVAEFLLQKPHDALEMFTEGDADFLLCYSPHDLPVMLDDARYQFHPVGVERLVCVSAATARGGPEFRLHQPTTAKSKAGVRNAPVPWFSPRAPRSS